MSVLLDTRHSSVIHSVLMKNNPLINFGLMKMKPDLQQLEEIVVSGERIVVTSGTDRTVYHINDMLAKSAATGKDLLSRIPSVHVDLNNNISVNGTNNMILLVNGQKKDKDFVGQIDPDLIDRVEVIDNPSIKYDGNFEAVINIILKTKIPEGLNGSMSLEIPNPKTAFSNSYARLNYGRQNTSFYVSANGNLRNFDSRLELLRNYGQVRSNSELFQEGTGKLVWKNLNINLGADIFMDEQNVLNIFANVHPHSMPSSSIQHESISQNGITINKQKTEIDVEDKNISYFGSAYYKGSLIKGNLAATVDYYLYDGSNVNTISSYSYDPEMEAYTIHPEMRFDNKENKRTAVNAKLDFTKKIKDKSEWSFGLKYYSQLINDHMLYGQNVETIQYFEYGEDRIAGYFSFNTSLKNLHINTGIRVEHANMILNGEELNSVTNWLPNLNLNYKFNNAENLKLYVGRWLIRPGAYQLNPLVSHLDPYTLSRGNPELLPAYTNRIKLSYVKRFGNHFVSPELYYDMYKNEFQNLSRVNQDNFTEIFPENVAEGSELGLGINASFKFFTKWMINGQFSCFTSKHESKQSDALNPYFSNSKVGTRAMVQSIFQLPKNYSVSFFYYWRSPRITLQDSKYQQGIYVFELGKSVMKNQGNIGICFYAPFMDTFRIEKTETTSQNYYRK